MDKGTSTCWVRNVSCTVAVVVACISAVGCAKSGAPRSSSHVRRPTTGAVQPAEVISPAGNDPVQAYLYEPDYHNQRVILRAWEHEDVDQKLMILHELTKHLSRTERVPFLNPEDAFVLPRDKEMEFQGHGVLINQDVFIIGGKAAWAIEEMLGIGWRLDCIKEAMSKDEREDAVITNIAFVTAYERGVADARGLKASD